MTSTTTPRTTPSLKAPSSIMFPSTSSTEQAMVVATSLTTSKSIRALPQPSAPTSPTASITGALTTFAITAQPSLPAPVVRKHTSLPLEIIDMIFEESIDSTDSRTPAIVAACRGDKTLYPRAIRAMGKKIPYLLSERNDWTFGKLGKFALSCILELHIKLGEPVYPNDAHNDGGRQAGYYPSEDTSPCLPNASKHLTSLTTIKLHNIEDASLVSLRLNSFFDCFTWENLKMLKRVEAVIELKDQCELELRSHEQFKLPLFLHMVSGRVGCKGKEVERVEWDLFYEGGLDTVEVMQRFIWEMEKGKMFPIVKGGRWWVKEGKTNFLEGW